MGHRETIYTVESRWDIVKPYTPRDREAVYTAGYGDVWDRLLLLYVDVTLIVC